MHVCVCVCVCVCVYLCMYVCQGQEEYAQLQPKKWRTPRADTQDKSSKAPKAPPETAQLYAAIDHRLHNNSAA